MCAICDGVDPDDLLDDFRHRVDQRGWTMVGVEPSHRGPGWIYSAGLTASFDHPEVVMVGAPPEAAYAVLAAIAEDVVDGLTFRHHESYEIGDLRFRFGWVHPRHFALGTFAWWEPVVAEVHPGTRRAALQVIPPPDLLRTPRRWRLDQPHPLP